MTSPAQPEPNSTTAQRAVLLAGVAAFVLLLAAEPLSWLWLDLHGTEARKEHRSNAWTAAPAMSPATLLDGSYTHGLEQQLQEESLVVWAMRGVWNETRLSLGLLQNDRVHLGRDGWMFLRPGLHPDPAVLDGQHERRIAAFQRIRQAVEQLGGVLFVVPLPDKDRLYPEFAFDDGVLPKDKARLYPLLLAELDAAGIAHLDANTVLAAQKAASSEPLYYQRDSHWRPLAAKTVATALAAALERAPFAERLGPREPGLQLSSPLTVSLIPDLVNSCGLRTVWRREPGIDFPLATPASPASAALTETKDYFTLVQQDTAAPGQTQPTTSRMPSSPIALAGSSFSGENGAACFAAALQRVVDARQVNVGAAALGSLRGVLERMSKEPGQVRVVVWEFVERAILEDEWTRPDRQ